MRDEELTSTSLPAAGPRCALLDPRNVPPTGSRIPAPLFDQVLGLIDASNLPERTLWRARHGGAVMGGLYVGALWGVHVYVPVLGHA